MIIIQNYTSKGNVLSLCTNAMYGTKEFDCLLVLLVIELSIIHIFPSFSYSSLCDFQASSFSVLLSMLYKSQFPLPNSNIFCTFKKKQKLLILFKMDFLAHGICCCTINRFCIHNQ
jgi:hypothetical protein